MSYQKEPCNGKCPYCEKECVVSQDIRYCKVCEKAWALSNESIHRFVDEVRNNEEVKRIYNEKRWCDSELKKEENEKYERVKELLRKVGNFPKCEKACSVDRYRSLEEQVWEIKKLHDEILGVF